MNEVPHPGFEKPGNYETLTTANQPEDIDRLTDIIYQQGTEKGKDEMRDTLLEWQRKRMKELEANEDDWSKGYICATLETFDKINSL